VIFDPNAERRSEGLKNLTPSIMKEVSYDSTSQLLHRTLQSIRPGEKYRMCGISLGGKVIIDYATKYPESFAGGVLTDVGLGSFLASELNHFVRKTIAAVNLDLPWAELRQQIRDLIPDKNMRILIQTQIAYPTGQPPAIWRNGMKSFGSMLQNQSLDDQFEDYLKVDDALAEAGSHLHILKASGLSGICAESFEKMKSVKSVRFEYLDAGTHFVHITHKENIIAAVLNLAP
jgi:pimeloyl-ACP methyl ester carboxylesterase